MAANEISQQQRLTQEQTLSARQMQSLELLHLPLLELQDRVLQELAENPLIEDVSSSAEETVPELAGAEPPSGIDDGASGDDDALPDDPDGEWLDDVPLPADAGNGDDGRRDYFFNSLTREPDLEEKLLAELRLADLSPEDYAIAETIVGSLDDSGYLATPPGDIAMACNAELDEVEKVLAIVQNIAPAGIAARNLSECLILQLERKHQCTPLLRRILNGELEEIGRNHLPQVAKNLGITLDELKAELEKIRRLDPHPGLSAAPEKESDYVVPELSIVPDGDGFKVVENREYLPKLHLSDRYCRMLEDPTVAGADRSYIKEKLASARELMRALELRQSTLVRIAEVIAQEQADFLRHGVERLKPLTMKHLAELLSVHETTVSRAVAGKYVSTPQGLFEFRYFFSGGYRGENGEEVSSRVIKEKIREIIDGENPAKPLSDDKVSALLKASGFDVARRTVAKYRESMNILPTNLRRRH